MSDWLPCPAGAKKSADMQTTLASAVAETARLQASGEQLRQVGLYLVIVR